MRRSLLLLFTFSINCVAAQKTDTAGFAKPVIKLNAEGTATIRFITLLQTWVRYVDYNSGTLYKEKQRRSANDISLRRIVFTAVGQAGEKVLFLLNLAGSSNSGEGAFQPGLNLGVLDAYGEYKFSNALHLGAGLHQWTGFSRLNADAVGTLLNIDQPAFQQITFNKLDKLGRFLGIYAKGDVGRFNYRLSVNDAFVGPKTNTVANSGKGSSSAGNLNAEAKNAQLNVAYMNPAANSKVLQGYVEFAFWDLENHTTPYEVSSYQGAKKLLNIGAGFLFRKHGILTPTNIALKDVALPESAANPKLLISATENNIAAFAADAIIMYPFSKEMDGITAYAGYFRTDLGPNYYTVTSILNNTSYALPGATINGAGNGYPGAGTGNIYYLQSGYIAPKKLLKTSRIGLFATYQHAAFEALKDAVKVYEIGTNWIVPLKKLKLSAMYRSRPVYEGVAAFGGNKSTAVVTGRKGEIITQLQINF